MSTQTTSENYPSLDELKAKYGGFFYQVALPVSLACAALELKHAELAVLASYWTCEELNMPSPPSFAQLASHWRISEKTIKRSVARLVECGLLIRPAGWKAGMRNAYVIDHARLDYEAKRGADKTIEEKEKRKAARSAAGRNAVNVRWDKVREKAQASTSLTLEEFEAMRDHYHEQDDE